MLELVTFSAGTISEDFSQYNHSWSFSDSGGSTTYVYSQPYSINPIDLTRFRSLTLEYEYSVRKNSWVGDKLYGYIGIGKTPQSSENKQTVYSFEGEITTRSGNGILTWDISDSYYINILLQSAGTSGNATIRIKNAILGV